MSHCEHCEHSCEHAHCALCGEAMSIASADVKFAEFVENFHREPTKEEQRQGTCCDDCYNKILGIERAKRN